MAKIVEGKRVESRSYFEDYFHLNLISIEIKEMITHINTLAQITIDRVFKPKPLKGKSSKPCLKAKVHVVIIPDDA